MKNLKIVLGRLWFFTVGIVALPLAVNGTRRTRVALYDQKTQRILLTQDTLSSGIWGLIGGGLRVNEDMFVGAVREVKEEVGASITSHDLSYIGQVDYREYTLHYTAHVFLALVDEFEPKLPQLEVVDAQWFKLSNLPPRHNQQTLAPIKQKITEINGPKPDN